MTRDVLFITTTFFPDPSVGAVRMTQWCRSLPRRGWMPHVLCRHYGHECSSELLAEKVHPGVRVQYLGQDSLAQEPRQGASGLGRLGLRRWAARLGRRVIRSAIAYRGVATLAVPDPSIRFWRTQRRRILEVVETVRPSVIVTSSPPHGNHDIGLWLSGAARLPWLADFRDPYLIDERFMPAGLGLVRRGAHRRFESCVYERASLVTHAIPVHARWARLRYPFARPRIRVLTNGFPSEMLGDTTKPGSAHDRRCVRVVGSILDREQRQLAEACARLVAEGEDVELHVVGMRPGRLEALRELLGDRLIAPGYVAHWEAVQMVRSADVLVSFLSPERSRTLGLSTKLFEYIASGRPVVAVNPTRAERWLIRRATNIRVIERPTVLDLAGVLKTALGQQGEVRVDQFRREFSWAAQTERLAGWLEELTRGERSLR